MQQSMPASEKPIQWAQLTVLGAACLLTVLVLYTRHFTSPLETKQLVYTQASLLIALVAMAVRVLAPSIAKRLLDSKTCEGKLEVSTDYQLARLFLMKTLFGVTLLSSAAFCCFLAYLYEGHAIALATGTIMFGGVVMQYRSNEAVQGWMQMQRVRA